MASTIAKSLAAVSCAAAFMAASASGAGGDALVAESASAGNGSLMRLALYVALALGVSFLCSVAEAVLLSLTPSYIQGLKASRPRLAAVLQRLKEDEIDRSLAAILTLNTIAHTVGAIGAGAEATALLGSAWFGIFSAVMTLMILFLSEIVPKTIGAVYWSRLVAPTAIFVRWLIVLLFPLVWVSERLTSLIARGKKPAPFSRAEFVAMARAGAESGGIKRKESHIIHNLMRFDSLRTSDIMTPRTVVSALPEKLSVSEAVDRLAKLPFSRLPVYRNNRDEITGFVLKDDVLVAEAKGRGGESLHAIKRPLTAVTEDLPLFTLLDRFLTERQHLAIVVDEYGGMRGLVTLEDLVETLVGWEIMDETDNVEDMRALAREKWAARARALGIDRGEPQKDST